MVRAKLNEINKNSVVLEVVVEKEELPPQLLEEVRFFDKLNERILEKYFEKLKDIYKEYWSEKSNYIDKNGCFVRGKEKYCKEEARIIMEKMNNEIKEAREKLDQLSEKVFSYIIKNSGASV